MTIRAADIVAFSDARGRLTELAKEAKNGHEKVLTLNGSSYVALIDAEQLDRYHALEAEFGHLVLLDAALVGLQDVAKGNILDEDQLNELLKDE
jgi:PHD/YefM family antitoxin component YafN of YafNO toxin-antitoxin module